jgi:hypothetical protein
LQYSKVSINCSEGYLSQHIKSNPGESPETS